MCSGHCSYQTFCNYEFNTSAVSEWALRKRNRSDHRERVCTNAIISITQKNCDLDREKKSEIQMTVQGLNQEDSFSSGNFHPVSCSYILFSETSQRWESLHFDTSLGHDLSSKSHKAGELQMNTLCLSQKLTQLNIL